MSWNRSNLWLVLIAAAALLGGALAYRQFSGHLSGQLTRQVPQLASGTALPSPRPLPPFSLTDHLGAPFGNAELRGAPHLVFFGFTHCPDICPTTLALLAQLTRDPAIGNLRPVFITVDPGRDDQETLRRYVDAFGGGLMGLRGEDAKLAPLTQTLGAAYEVRPAPGGSIVDHTATLYYLDANGRLAAVFTPPFSLTKLRADLALLAGG